MTVRKPYSWPLWISLLAGLVGACSSSPNTVPTPPPAKCSHSPCEVSTTPLTSTCDSCVGRICGKYPSCCGDGGWDQTCQGQVSALCGQRCTCNTIYDAGPPPFNPQACGDCTYKVCQRYTACCSTSTTGAAWDATCVAYLKSLNLQGCPGVPVVDASASGG